MTNTQGSGAHPHQAASSRRAPTICPQELFHQLHASLDSPPCHEIDHLCVETTWTSWTSRADWSSQANGITSWAALLGAVKSKASSELDHAVDQRADYDLDQQAYHDVYKKADHAFDETAHHDSDQKTHHDFDQQAQHASEGHAHLGDQMVSVVAMVILTPRQHLLQGPW